MTSTRASTSTWRTPSWSRSEPLSGAGLQPASGSVAGYKPAPRSEDEDGRLQTCPTMQHRGGIRSMKQTYPAGLALATLALLAGLSLTTLGQNAGTAPGA